MSLPVFDDEQVRRLPRAAAVSAVRAVLEQLAHEEVVAPARQEVNLGDGSIVVTGGRLTHPDVRGFRAYETKGDRQQMVVLWDETGRIGAVVHGTELGPLRTGALGAVAVDHLAPSEVSVLGILGTGPQAMEQLACIATVRSVTSVIVWSPREESRRAFVERARELHGIVVRPGCCRAEVLAEADVLVCATNAVRPILAATDLGGIAHINAVGPKRSRDHELPRRVFDEAGLLVTDSLSQAHAYRDPLVDPSTLQPLAPLVAEGATRPTDLGRSVFVSLGLAGTELAVAWAVRDLSS